MSEAQPYTPDTVDTTEPGPVLSRRKVLEGLLAAAAAVGVTASCGLFDKERPGSGTEETDLSELGNDGFDDAEMKEAVDSLRSRADELKEKSVQELARKILDSETISYDENFPRVRESFVWASQEGIFPLREIKEGDTAEAAKGTDRAVELGMEITVTSAATGEHSDTSHHLQGRAVDFRVPKTEDESLALMELIYILNKYGIVKIDEAFEPKNVGGFNLNEGEPTTFTEPDHIHVSTSQETSAIAKTEEETKPSEEAEPPIITQDSYDFIDEDLADFLAEERGFAAEGTDRLLTGVFGEGVEALSEEIETAAKNEGIPVNFLAAIVKIESNGRTDAVSKADAHGLVQLVPKWHRDRIDDYAERHNQKVPTTDEERGEYLRAYPEANLDIGANYLRELLDRTKERYPGLNPNHPLIYMVAAGAYNGGPDLISKDLDKWPAEAQNYYRLVRGLYLDVSKKLDD